MQTVLISGASVAGPALAYWLHRRGLAPTVVERAPALRTGGHAIDIRGAALEVIRRMGLAEPARALRTRMRGMSLLDGDGNELMRSTELTFSSGRLDSDDIELLREDLVRLLYEQTREHVEYRFGDSITAIDEDSSGVRVHFEHGPPRVFDLVVGADGLHSNVRNLVFGPERPFIHHLGRHAAIFAAENFLGLDNWQVWLRGDSAGYGIYPVRDNRELRITAGFRSEPFDDVLDVEQQKRLLADKLASLGWETPRLVQAMWQAPDFYFDSMAQVRLDRWSKGRVVLLGDAGYCASPMSGQGTSLAVVGAYVLADELGWARGGDVQEALARYEQRMRPFAALNQALATEDQDGPAPPAALERAKNAICLDDEGGLTAAGP